MLMCCNTFFRGVFRCIVQNNNYGFRQIEFGVCPQCGSYCFIDYKENAYGESRSKTLHGKEALTKYNLWKECFYSKAHGSYSNQNVYYGDFRKTNKKDNMGNPIYLQLRKNFNNQIEILNEIETHKYVSEAGCLNFL